MTMLGHLKVIDLTRDLGSYAGVALAGLGADVLQIEWAPPVGDAAEIAMSRRGKRVQAMALDDAELLHLIAAADIVLRGPETALTPISPVAAVAANPKLIDIVILAFNADGPNADRPATDLTVMARSGLVSIVGDPDRPPLALPGRQAWTLTGIHAAIAALTALNARAASGLGDQVRVYAYRAAVLANYREPVTWQWQARTGARTGNLLVRGKSGVNQVWQCADGWVTWAMVDNPPMMRAFVAQMETDNMAGALADVDWDAILVADMPQETLKAWEGEVAAWLATKRRTDLTEASNRTGMGLSAIDEPVDVLASDHLAARGLWRNEILDGQEVRVPGAFFLRS